MSLTMQELKEAYPDVYAAIEKDGYDKGHAEGLSAGQDTGRKEGAEAERARIKSVEEQAIAGHEDLIARLKFDGATTGPEAAVQILAAEKKLRESNLESFRADHVAFVPAAHAPVADPQPAAADDTHLPLKDRAQKAWEKDPAIRAEFFDDFQAYLSYAEQEAAGNVRIYKGKGGN